VSTRATPRNPQEEEKDLGFGSVVAKESRQRLLNRDGSFNVARKHLGWFASLSPYHSLLTISWPRFLAVVTFAYLALNGVFGLAFTLCGPNALQGPDDTGPFHTGFLRAFFFSIETFSTIGYGDVRPMGVLPHVLVLLEAIVSLLGFALATGLVFARFSRPSIKMLFSDTAVIAPYRGITAFEFRIVNLRSSQLIELEAKVLFSRLETGSGTTRRFHDLPLERKKVAFFPLSWTVVHPIDESSPLFGLTPSELHAVDAEFLILLTGIDETFSQTVHTRSSYKADEIVWNARFANIFNRHEDGGPLTIDIDRLHEVDRLPG
jgi:inward rectifier potassium channel